MIATQQKFVYFLRQKIYANFRRRIKARSLGGESKIEVRIKSIQFIDSKNVQIRILRKISAAGSPSNSVNEVINLGFHFSPQINLTMEERFINPLGFQVTKYDITQEVFSY